MEDLSIYIHIPFCEKKCAYCDFVSFEQKESCIDKYVSYLCKELEYRSNKNYVVQTIYIGGGTPSLLSINNIQQIFTTIKKNYKVKENAEITIEINPNSINENKLNTYKSVGVNRISIGVQSLNNKCLKTLGRIHNKKQAKQAIKLVEKCGFNNISADVMIGIPKLNIFKLLQSLLFLSKHCSHISAYMLILEEGTPLYNSVQSKNIKLPSEEKTLKQYEIATSFLKRKGFNRYEISNFAKTNYESQHNKRYWDFSSYLGFGVSAHSYINGNRYWGKNSLKEYFDAIDNNFEKLLSCEEIDEEKRNEEYIMLSLRTKTGINLQEYERAFSKSLLTTKNKEIKMLEKEKFIIVDNGFLKPTEKGIKVLNQIILQLT